MLEATFWGFVGGVALVVGAVAGIRLHASQRVIGLIMAFGSGVLISALTFELTAESFRRGGADTVVLSNVPESLSAATGLQRAGHSPRWILSLWLAVTVAGVGYAVLGDASPSLVGFIQAFAAGAILTMLADTMMPEAYEHGGNVVGLVTLLGFSLAFVLSTVE